MGLPFISLVDRSSLLFAVHHNLSGFKFITLYFAFITNKQMKINKPLIAAMMFFFVAPLIIGIVLVCGHNTFTPATQVNMFCSAVFMMFIAFIVSLVINPFK